MVGIRIGYGEADLWQKVKESGAIWRPQQKLRELRYDQSRALGLTARIISGQISTYATNKDWRRIMVVGSSKW